MIAGDILAGSLEFPPCKSLPIDIDKKDWIFSAALTHIDQRGQPSPLLLNRIPPLYDLVSRLIGQITRLYERLPLDNFDESPCSTIELCGPPVRAPGFVVESLDCLVGSPCFLSESAGLLIEFLRLMTCSSGREEGITPGAPVPFTRPAGMACWAEAGPRVLFSYRFVWIFKEYEDRYKKSIKIGAEPPLPGVLYGYGLDLSRCIGCRRCVYACVDENNQSKNYWRSTYNGLYL